MKTSSSNEFNLRLAAYSTTAAAALLIAPPAEAGIVDLSGSTTTFILTGSITFFPLNQSPFQAIIYGLATDNNATNFFCSAHLGNLGNGQILDYGFSGSKAEKLGLGVHFAGYNFADFREKGTLAFEHNSFGYKDFSGQFVPGSHGTAMTGYVGLKTVQNGHTYYGWLRVKVSGNAYGAMDSVSLVAVDGIVGAYDTKDDVIIDSFAAGVTVTPTPEPSVAALGGLALLACGAVGVREQRRRQAAAKKN